MDPLAGVNAGIFIFESNGQNFKKGQNASICKNGLFLNGNIKNIIPNLNNEASKTQIEIKSSAGILIDSVVPFPLESNNVSLRTIITNVCGCWGIPVSFANDSRLDLISKTEIDNSFTAHLTEYAWDYLVRITSAKGMFIQDTGNGLYIGNILPQKPIISFIEGSAIGVTAWKPKFKTENLARYYEAHTQFPVSASAVAQIPFDLPITKRVIKKDATEGGIQDFANWSACRAIGDAFKVVLELDDSINIVSGNYAVIKSETCGIYEETEMIVENVLHYDPIGMQIQFTLPCAYTGVIPESLPLC